MSHLENRAKINVSYFDVQGETKRRDHLCLLIIVTAAICKPSGLSRKVDEEQVFFSQRGAIWAVFLAMKSRGWYASLKLHQTDGGNLMLDGKANTTP